MSGNNAGGLNLNLKHIMELQISSDRKRSREKLQELQISSSGNISRHGSLGKSGLLAESVSSVFESRCSTHHTRIQTLLPVNTS